VRRRGSKSATQDWGCTDGDAQRLLISLRAEGERTSYTTLTLPRRPTASTWTWRPARLWIVTEQKRGSEAEAEACLMKRQKGWGQGAFLACPAETNLKAENSRRASLSSAAVPCFFASPVTAAVRPLTRKTPGCHGTTTGKSKSTRRRTTPQLSPNVSTSLFLHVRLLCQWINGFPGVRR
jgi:hypothetical protein